MTYYWQKELTIAELTYSEYRYKYLDVKNTISHIRNLTIKTQEDLDYITEKYNIWIHVNNEIDLILELIDKLEEYKGKYEYRKEIYNKEYHNIYWEFMED